MNVVVRSIFLFAAAMALTPVGASDAQTTIKPPPKGGLIPTGPSSMEPRGPNGEVVSGPGGSAVRGPNSGEIGRNTAASEPRARSAGRSTHRRRHPRSARRVEQR